MLHQDTSSIDALSPLELLPLDLNLEPCCEAISDSDLHTAHFGAISAHQWFLVVPCEAILESLGTCSARIVSWNLLAPSYCSGAFFKD